MRKFHRAVMVGVATGVIFSFISVSYADNGNQNTSNGNQNASQDAVKPIVVNVVQVTTENIPKVLDALGSLSAIQSVNVSAETAGRISSINFKNGQQVAKGMPIVQLDNEQAEADYQSAVTAYQLARANYERGVPLLQLGGISKQDLDKLKAAVATTKATVQSKLASLNEKQVVAPFSGVLGSFNYQVGDYVNAGDTLVTLVNSLQLRADYNLAEQYVPDLRSGQLVQVTTSAYPNQKFYGTVTYISPTISQATRMVAVEANIANAKNLLSAGMFVHIQQQIGEIKNATVIPSAAVSADIKGYFVYKVEGNQAVQTYITIGTRLPNKMQILSGLKPGDTIVVAGQEKLEDGSTIEISSNSDGSTTTDATENDQGQGKSK